MNAKEEPAVTRMVGVIENPIDAVDLRGYPQLTYAPLQWGEGIRLHKNGLPVTQIAAAAKRIDLVGGIEQVCMGLDLTWEELFDALRYARDHGPL